MKVITKGIVVPLDEDPRPQVQHMNGSGIGPSSQVLGCLTEVEIKPPEKVKKRKRGRPRKNIKFIPFSSNRAIVYQEEGEEDPQDMFLGKRTEEVESSGESEEQQG